MSQTGLTSYLTRRANHRTRLIRRGPASSGEPPLILPPSAREFAYRSKGRDLKIFVDFPEGQDEEYAPCLLFLHGGCRLNEDHFEFIRPFLDQGLIVVLPTMRGENGNPGDFELFWGEVDDAVEAVKWIAAQLFCNRKAIYSFGWSMGGEVSALLSLFPGLPLRFTGSVGAFFGRPDRFGARSMFGTPLPFDATNPEECSLRTLAGNEHDMQCRHLGYIGVDDAQFPGKPYRDLDLSDTLLTIVEVNGDHDSSVAPAVSAFAKMIEQDLDSLAVSRQS